MEIKKAAIVGIGATEFSKNSGRSELQLAVEAALDALRDAGLEPGSIDGIVTYSVDNNDEQAVARSLGIDHLNFFARTVAGGGGPAGTIQLAEMAIATGKAEVVLCFRAMNERSAERYGQPEYLTAESAPPNPGSRHIDRSWNTSFGSVSPASLAARSVRRYMHEYGITSEDFGRQAVIQREFANNNPFAMFHDRTLTLEEHQSSRMIADPLRLYDCCLETDGAVAILVTSAARARDLKNIGVEVLASGMGIRANCHGMSSAYDDQLASAAETEIVGRQLWAQSGLTPADIDMGIIYDHFSAGVLMQLEALGFCGPGEAGAFVADGGTRLGGALPTNTNGGQLSEGYVHGMNGIAEAVRQLRGTSVNQVAGAELAVVTGGSHVPTSGLILGQLR